MNSNKINMKNKLKINNDIYFSRCLAAYFLLCVIDRVSKIMFNGGLKALNLLVQYGAYILAIATILLLIQKFSTIKILIFVELLITIVFLVSFFMGNLGDLNWAYRYRQIAIIFIPLSIAAYSIIDRKRLLKYLYGISLISAPVLILVTLLSYRTWSSSYDMSLGYMMVFVALVLLVDFTIYKRAIDIILAIILCLFILFTGSRGPFICLLAFLIFELVLCKQYSIQKRLIILSVIAIAIVLILVNFDNILALVSKATEEMELNSRSIRLLLQGELVSHDSGRGEVWHYYINMINEKPAFGYGVMGGWIADEMYPHNIVLELILSFGYPLGIVMSAVVFICMFLGIRSDNKYNSALAILFVSFCMQLLVSNSYLKVWQFFICLALCMPKKYKFANRFAGYREVNFFLIRQTKNE